MIGSELARFLKLFIAARSGDNARAKQFGDLNRRAADSAACAEDQYVFSRLKLRASDEHVPRRLEDERDSGGFLERKIFGIRHTVYFGSADEFGAAAINHVAE